MEIQVDRGWCCENRGWHVRRPRNMRHQFPRKIGDSVSRRLFDTLVMNSRLVLLVILKQYRWITNNLTNNLCRAIKV